MDLNSCKKCGAGKGFVALIHDDQGHYVFCYNCHTYGPDHDDAESAAEAWNSGNQTADPMYIPKVKEEE